MAHPHVWSISKGEMYTVGKLVGVGYSGWGDHKNQPLSQHVPHCGPIPEGAYLIGEPHDSDKTGAFVMDLWPVMGTQLYGRSSFQLHGDNRHEPGKASRGCIVMDREPREQVAEQMKNNRQLLVVP